MPDESNLMPAEFAGRPITYRNAPDVEWLYRFYGDEGLLYAGITHTGTMRFQGHAKDKAWWPSVTRIEVEHYPDRSSVRIAECEAIRDDRPAFNIADRGAYAAQAAKHAEQHKRLLDVLREERCRADRLERDNEKLRETLRALESRRDEPEPDPEPPATAALRGRHLRLVA